MALQSWHISSTHDHLSIEEVPRSSSSFHSPQPVSEFAILSSDLIPATSSVTQSDVTHPTELSPCESIKAGRSTPSVCPTHELGPETRQLLLSALRTMMEVYIYVSSLQQDPWTQVQKQFRHMQLERWALLSSEDTFRVTSDQPSSSFDVSLDRSTSPVLRTRSHFSLVTFSPHGVTNHAEVIHLKDLRESDGYLKRWQIWV